MHIFPDVHFAESVWLVQPDETSLHPEWEAVQLESALQTSEEILSRLHLDAQDVAPEVVNRLHIVFDEHVVVFRAAQAALSAVVLGVQSTGA
jgi:hypothetical protein